MKEEKKCLKKLLRKIEFHSYTVWCCPNEECNAYFNYYHDKCRYCGAGPLEAQRSNHRAPED